MKLCIENWFQILLSKFRKKKQETKIGLSNTPVRPVHESWKFMHEKVITI